MSYILNALKKAEQDRLREDPKDLEDFASARWDPYEQKPSSTKAIVVLFCVLAAILSVALVVYLKVLQSPAQLEESEFVSPSIPEVIDEQPNQPQIAVESDPYALPAMNVSGHMYFAEGSPSNRLFANNQSYKEGDMVGNNWRLASIGIDGIELTNNDQSVFIAYP